MHGHVNVLCCVVLTNVATSTVTSSENYRLQQSTSNSTKNADRRGRICVTGIIMLMTILIENYYRQRKILLFLTRARRDLGINTENVKICKDYCWRRINSITRDTGNPIHGK